MVPLLFPPKRGDFQLAGSLPRALPWATLFCPYRAKIIFGLNKSVFHLLRRWLTFPCFVLRLP